MNLPPASSSPRADVVRPSTPRGLARTESSGAPQVDQWTPGPKTSSKPAATAMIPKAARPDGPWRQRWERLKEPKTWFVKDWMGPEAAKHAQRAGAACSIGTGCLAAGLICIPFMHVAWVVSFALFGVALASYGVAGYYGFRAYRAHKAELAAAKAAPPPDATV